jgi:hypothetical protein
MTDGVRLRMRRGAAVRPVCGRARMLRARRGRARHPRAGHSRLRRALRNALLRRGRRLRGGLLCGRRCGGSRPAGSSVRLHVRLGVRRRRRRGLCGRRDRKQTHQDDRAAPCRKSASLASGRSGCIWRCDHPGHCHPQRAFEYLKAQRKPALWPCQHRNRVTARNTPRGVPRNRNPSSERVPRLRRRSVRLDRSPSKWHGAT